MAVPTVISKSNVEKILTKYSIGRLEYFNGIKDGIENTNYLIVTSKNKFILTIYEDRIENDLLPFYLDLMLNSFGKGILCPVPIKDKNDNLLNYIKNKAFGIFTFLEGTSLKSWDESNCFDVGKELAKLHIANMYYKTEQGNNFGLNFWNSLFEKSKSFLNEIIPNSYQIINDEINFINKNWPKNLPKGVIHADLFPDNLLFDSSNKITGIIDFYFSCYDFLSYDLAILINAWCFPKNVFNKSFMTNIIKGYETLRVLEIEEKVKLNILLRGASLRFLLTRLIDARKLFKNKFVNKKNPVEFYKRLLFHRNLKNELTKF